MSPPILTRKPAAPLTEEDYDILDRWNDQRVGYLVKHTAYVMLEADIREATVMLRHVCNKERETRRVWKILTAAAAALIMQGCTTLAPGATGVRVTSHPAEVSQCRPAGAVSVPYNPIPANTIGLATNQVVALQADTLLVTQSFPAYLGVAYRCRS